MTVSFDPDHLKTQQHVRANSPQRTKRKNKKEIIVMDLRNSAEQFISGAVPIEARVKVAACKLAVGPLELCQEELVVVVGVEQRPNVTSKLVKPG